MISGFRSSNQSAGLVGPDGCQSGNTFPPDGAVARPIDRRSASANAFRRPSRAILSASVCASDARWNANGPRRPRMSNGKRSTSAPSNAVFHTVMTRWSPRALLAYPSSIRTLGFATAFPAAEMAIGVTSPTKTAAASILARIVATISGDPGTPCVSEVSSCRSSISACRSSIANCSAPRMTSRVTRLSRSLCQDQKIVLIEWLAS